VHLLDEERVTPREPGGTPNPADRFGMASVPGLAVNQYRVEAVQLAMFAEQALAVQISGETSQIRIVFKIVSTTMTDAFALGLDTFGDITAAPDGTLNSYAQVLRDVVEEAALADRLGIDAFGVGEHHRPDFAISAPEVVLAAIASRTGRMLLGSAVTVLSTDDPVRVFERFSTLDGLSKGRAEVILGRGSFTESYPLFGYDLSRYEELFEDKLQLFAELLKGGPVTWSGSTRAPIAGMRVYPPSEQRLRPERGAEAPSESERGWGPASAERSLRAWVGVGGSPESVVRAARYALPLTLAIIGGHPVRFKVFADLYRQSLERLGQPPLPIAVHSPGHVAATDEQARRELWPHYEILINRIGGERGWPPVTPAQFEREAGPDGALCVGSPETVAAKIARTSQLLGLSRFNVKYSCGTLPHDKMMTSIELLGTQVAPRVREILGSVPVAR
jgi:alkanesulfonate monooxygenase SsuD/methylene tetrahydromethanopterin reductase-like flavin-dependent oxidoreductase (luciferase family)